MKMFLVFTTTVFASIVGANSLQMVPIAEWSGSESQRKEVLKNPVNLVVILHTASKKCSTDDECDEVAKSVRRWQLSEGFDDVGYSFMIGGNGKVYEGAGWEKVGAHTKTYNDKAIGLGFIGNFMEKLPTAEALQAAKDLIKYGVDNNHITADYQMVGHRQLSATLSPGDALYAEIQTWPN